MKARPHEPIRASEIVAFLELNGIDSPTRREEVARDVEACDAVWMQWLASKAPGRESSRGDAKARD